VCEIQQAVQKKDIGETFKILLWLTDQQVRKPENCAYRSKKRPANSLCLWRKHINNLLNSDSPNGIELSLITAAPETYVPPILPNFSPKRLN